MPVNWPRVWQGSLISCPPWQTSGKRGGASFKWGCVSTVMTPDQWQRLSWSYWARSSGFAPRRRQMLAGSLDCILNFLSSHQKKSAALPNLKVDPILKIISLTSRYIGIATCHHPTKLEKYLDTPKLNRPKYQKPPAPHRRSLRCFRGTMTGHRLPVLYHSGFMSLFGLPPLYFFFGAVLTLMSGVIFLW